MYELLRPPRIADTVIVRGPPTLVTHSLVNALTTVRAKIKNIGFTAATSGPGRVAEWLWREVQVKNFSELSSEILLTQVAQVRVLPRSFLHLFWPGQKVVNIPLLLVCL